MSTSIISPFWYKRANEAVTLVSALVIALYAGNGYLDINLSEVLTVPMWSAVTAFVALVVSIVAYFLKSSTAQHIATYIGYILLVGTVGLVVHDSGGVHSPFLALWMLTTVFSGMFGLSGLAILSAVINGYLVYMFAGDNTPTSTELIVFALSGELPLFISYVLWHNKSGKDSAKEKAFSALAAELSSVASKSEIVINAIADGVIAIDGQGVIRLINPAAQHIIGWGKQDAIGLDYRSVLKLVDKKAQAIVETNDPVRQVLNNRQSVLNNELFLVTDAGKQMSLSLMVSPVGMQGEGAIIVFRDITKQKQEESEQAEFISTASHEMRTPVAAIEGYLGLALNPQTAVIDDKARAYLMKAHESAQHLGRLFQDLLDVSKADDHRLNNNPVVIDVVAFMTDVVNEFTPKAQAKGLILTFKPTGNDAASRRISPVFYTRVDYDHLREIINNLIDNGIKYTKAGSVIVDITGDTANLVISIKDTGIGIPAEDIPHLFQKFYRVDNTDTREIGGTGLGLYLCRRLVETMNGRIWAESEYGKGSTFNVQLPRISREDAMSSVEAAAETIAPAQSAVINIPPSATPPQGPQT